VPVENIKISLHIQ